ncbi:MAG: hypothetical protein GY821_04850 [Gammaproteobacteria bacterium]|nr:hypothetical protein [Gammaproteobacteria bacterium]
MAVTQIYFAQAKKRGVYATKGKTKLRQRVKQRESKSQLAREFGVCWATIYKYLIEN